MWWIGKLQSLDTPFNGFWSAACHRLDRSCLGWGLFWCTTKMDSLWQWWKSFLWKIPGEETDFSILLHSLMKRYFALKKFSNISSVIIWEQSCHWGQTGGSETPASHTFYSRFPPPYQGFWNFARSRSREIQVYTRNPAKLTKTCEKPRNSLEILPKTCRYNIFETYLGYWSCLLAVNLQIYLEFSSLPRVNNVPKLPGVNVAKNWAREMRRLFVDTIQRTKGNCCVW